MCQNMPPRSYRSASQLSAREKSTREAQGIKPSLRFRIEGEKLGFCDIIRGELGFDLATFGDFIILRSDGWPIYNFAAVIDDSLMNISHIIRGEDHLSNTPKQLLLYQALGFSPPLGYNNKGRLTIVIVPQGS